MAKSDFLFFWGGEFSQWYDSEFELDGVKYNCAEQYMMHQKALLFEDTISAKKILETHNPKQQKAIGRQVRGFDAQKWTDVSYDIVLKGNIAKFTQNDKLREYILSTKDIEVVEASPEDKIWGIGLRESDSRAWDKTKWQGTNLLGKVIMETRKILRDAKSR